MSIMENDDKYLNKLSDRDINTLIDNLCSTRENNPDVMVLDQINSGQYPITEEEANQQAMNIMNEEIIDSTIASGIPLSMEEVNSFKAAGIYNQYLEKLSNRNKEEDDIMQSMEEEIRQGLINEETVTEVVAEPDTEATLTSDNSFQETNEEHMEVIQTQDTPVTEEDIEPVKEKSEIDIEPGMTIEQFNDVPATSINLPDEVLVDAISDKYGDDVSPEDAMQLINVINRFKSGEKFKVFDELPKQFRNTIEKEAMACGADKATMEFFAKSFINDLVNNTFMDKEIDNFNAELKEVLAPMSNIAGTVLDEYSDETYHNFTDKMEATANEIEEKDLEKAKELRLVSATFKDAISLSRVINLIETNPSIINRAYKQARDNGADFIRTYDKRVSSIDPSPRKIIDYKRGLTISELNQEYSDAYLDTLIVLVGNEIIKALDNSDAIEGGSVTEHIYAYYSSNAIYTLSITAGNSESNKIARESVIKILDAIKKYMLPLESRNTRKNRKRNKK